MYDMYQFFNQENLLICLLNLHTMKSTTCRYIYIFTNSFEVRYISVQPNKHINAYEVKNSSSSCTLQQSTDALNGNCKYYTEWQS